MESLCELGRLGEALDAVATHTRFAKENPTHGSKHKNDQSKGHTSQEEAKQGDNKMLCMKRATSVKHQGREREKRQRIFSRGIEGLEPPPSPRCGTP